MSRFQQTHNYGVPPNTHPTHVSAISSNVNRQTGNTNKYEKAPSQTNSNKYEQQNQPQIPLANVSSQQQQQLQQQPKAKLVNQEYAISVHNPPGSHQHGVALSHNSYRMPHANSNYNVTHSNVNYSQSVPPQPPAHQTSDRQTVCQIGQQQQTQQTSQQAQDHKMNQQQSHNTYSYMGPRNQSIRGSGGQAARMANNAIVVRQQAGQQQPGQYTQPPHGQPVHTVYMQPAIWPHSSFYSGKYPPSFQPGGFAPTPQGSIAYIQAPLSIQQRGGVPTNPQHNISLGAGVAGAGSSQIQTHQQTPHLQNHITHMTPYLTQIQRPQQTTEQTQKRQSKRIPIIDPNTEEEIKIDKVQKNSGSNPHSSALKIEAPSTSQIPNQNQQKTSSESTCDTGNEPEQSTCDHPNVEVPIEPSNIEEPPHTPVVSAIADGPSIDIMPKQSKNVKRINKSPEWPTPSAEKTNTDSSTCDNYSKVASIGNTTSSSSNEWVKTNQSAPKVHSETEHKDSQLRHNPKSKHPAPNQNVSTQSNKGSKAVPQPDNSANMVANVKQTASSAEKEQQQQQPQPQQQPTSESKSAVPATVPPEPTKVDTTSIGRSSEKAKQQQAPQPAEKVYPEDSATKSNKEKAIDNTNMSNSSSVNVVTDIADVDKTKQTKTTTNTSIDETDKLINSLDSMSISKKETNTEKNDKLDAKSVEFNNNSQNVAAPKVDVEQVTSQPTDIAAVESPEPAQVIVTPKNESQTDLRSSENDSRASEKTDTTVSSPATATNNGLAETIINNNLTNTTSANNNQLNNNNTVDKDSDNNVLNPATDKTATESKQQPQPTQQQQQQKQAQSQPQAQLQAQPQQQPQPQPNSQSVQQPVKPKVLLNYDEGQWSPDNTEGKKCYNRQQIMLLREAEASQSLPQIQDSFSLIRKNSPSNVNNNNNKNQSSSSSNRNQYTKRPSTQGGAGGNQQISQGGGKGSKSGMIHVSLSLREDVKLNESANAWKPTFLGQTAVVGDPNNIEVLCKRVRGILNKLTPEKFEPLLEQLQTLNIDSNEKLSSVISLVFEKAIDEPNFSSAYAQLCHKLSRPMEEKEEAERKSGDKSSKDAAQPGFKKELLNKCQIEFNTHVANENSIREKLKPLYQELEETNDSNRKLELSSQLEEEERKLRRRSVGTVRFIGELYRQNMLLTSIMEWCVMTLLNIRTEEKLECLCKLLTTVGQKMEQKTHDEEYDKKYYRDLTPHFQTMQAIASDKKQSKISSRVRFMLMDVIELRKNKWVPRRTDSNPKKMGQIQKEVMEEHYKKEIQMLASMPSSGGMGNNNNMRKDNRDRGDRGSMPRGGSMSGSGYNNSNKLNRSYQDNDGWIQTGGNKGRGGSNNNVFDPSKFRTPSNIEDITKTSFGTPNQFKWKFNAQPPQTATSLTNSFSALESDTYKPLSGNRSKEPYHSKGSMERERDGPGSRSGSQHGSQHGSRDNSAARNAYSSRSLQMRPPMQYNTLPLNSTSSSSSSQRGIRSDNKLNNQSLSSSTTSLSTSNLPSSSSLTPSSSDPKLSEDISEQTEQVIHSILKNLLHKVQKNDISDYDGMEDAPQLDKINQMHRWALVRDLHNMAVDISGLTEAKRCFVGIICTYWLNHKQITKQDYVRGLSEFITMLADIVIDVPKVYEWTAQMISVAVFNKIIGLNDLKNTAEESRGQLLGILLPFLAYEYGPQYVRDLWKQSDCKWEQFDSNVEQFLERYKLKFVENPKETLPPASEQIPNDRLRQRIRQLIRDKPSEVDVNDVNDVNEYIKIHVPITNKQSIRLLTKTLIEAALSNNKASYALDEAVLTRSVNILKEYIGGEQKQDLQLESLYAIQLLSNELEHPSGLLFKVFSSLFDNEVVPASVFKKWQMSNEEPLGKGVAVKNLTSFLNFLDESDEEDEEDAK